MSATADPERPGRPRDPPTESGNDAEGEVGHSLGRVQADDARDTRRTATEADLVKRLDAALSLGTTPVQGGRPAGE